MAIGDWGVALIGLGSIAQRHLEAYRQQGFCIVGGADMDPGRVESAAQRFGLPFSTTDYRELLARDEVRVVDVAIPHIPGLRKPVIEAAARAGKALFVQKPLASYLAEARELVEIAATCGVPLMVNQNSLFVPGFQAIEPYLRDPQWLGRPYYCQIENRSWWDVPTTHWYAKGERWIIADMAVHHIALVRHWFGDIDSVYAVAAADPSQTGIKGENVGVLVLTFQSGVRATLINNWCYRGGHRARGHPREEVVIQGDQGTISGDSEEMCVFTTNPVPARLFPQINGRWFPDAFGGAMRHFLEALDQGRPYLCGGADNLMTVAVVEAAYRSIGERRVVRVGSDSRPGTAANSINAGRNPG